jgi:hypothetical protein
MKRMHLFVLLAFIICAMSAPAQYVVSAHSGLLNKVEGQVNLEGKSIEPKFGEFPEMKNGQTLATEDGRAEVLLTPGAFLRVNENSSFQMINNKLADTRVKVLTGTVLLELAEILPQNGITLLYGDASITILKKGLYRIDCEPTARLRVYDGEAQVTSGDDSLTAKRGREVALGAVLSASNFDPKVTDEFYRWASRRSEDVAQANVSSAKAANGFTSSSWNYNPWFGLYTYIPYNGIYWSPFGYGYYSPYAVNYLYYNPGYYSGFGNGSRGGTTAQTYSNGTSSHYDSSVGYNVSPRSGISSGSMSSGGYSSGMGSAGMGSTSAGSASSGGSRGGGGGAASGGGGGHGH